MLLIAPPPSQNKHRDNNITAFNPLSISDHELAISTGSPTMVFDHTALPVITKRSLTVIHAEVLPANLLSNQRLHSIGDQHAVMHKFRRFLTPLRRKVTTELTELNTVKAHPASISQ